MPLGLGDIVMITHQFGPVSNLATWEERVEVYDAETEAPINLSLEVDDIIVTLRDPHAGSTVLSGSFTGNVVYLIGGGTSGAFGWTFPVKSMKALEPKTYEVGVLLDIEDETAQLILGRITVLRGL